MPFNDVLRGDHNGHCVMVISNFQVVKLRLFRCSYYSNEVVVVVYCDHPTPHLRDLNFEFPAVAPKVTWNYVVIRTHAKGQFISKAIYSLLTCFQKRTDKFFLFAFLLFTTNKSNFSFLVLSDLYWEMINLWHISKIIKIDPQILLHFGPF